MRDPNIEIVKTGNSTMFIAIGYNVFTHILVVTFRNTGQMRRYHSFPAAQWQRFKKSLSKGKFYNKYVRNNPEYQSEKA